MKDIKKYFKNKYEYEGILSRLAKFLVPAILGGIMLNLSLSFVRECKVDNLSSFAGSMCKLSLPFLCLSVLTLILATAILFYRNKYQVQGITKQFSIYSLYSDKRTKSKLSGTFFLGCGSVNGSSEEIDYYVFFEEGKFGLIKSKIKAYGIEVIQRDDIEPSYKEILVDGEMVKCLFVPENTIKKEIKIN